MNSNLELACFGVVLMVLLIAGAIITAVFNYLN